MGALLVVGLAGTWWVIIDARGLGIGGWSFAFLLLSAMSLPITVSTRRRITGQPLVIDLRDDVDRLGSRLPPPALINGELPAPKRHPKRVARR